MDNNQKFIDFLEEKSKGGKKKPHKIEKVDFLRSLETYQQYFASTMQVQRIGSQYSINLKKTTKEGELKQQKQIVQLEQKLHQLVKESQELRLNNHDIYQDVKKQKQLIKSLKREQQQYEDNKIIWEKKLENTQKNININQSIADNVKIVLNRMNDDIDKQALVTAKRQLKK